MKESQSFSSASPRRLCAGIAGVVDQDGDRPEDCDAFGDHLVDALAIGDVGLDGQRFAASRPNLRCHRFGALREEVIDDDPAAVARQVQGNLSAYILSGPRDDSHPP